MPIFRLRDIPDKEPEWLWPGWILRGAVSQFYALQGTGKTQVYISLASIILDGKEFPDGTVSPPGTILIFDFENGLLEMRRRSVNMGINPEHPNLYIFSPYDLAGTSPDFLNITNQKDYEKVKEIVGDIKPDWVVIDPLVAFHDKDEIKAPQMRKLTTLQTSIALLFNCGWTVIHHPSKDREAKGFNRSRGSSDLTAGPRTVFTLVPRQETDELILHMEKTNNTQPPDDIVCKMDDKGVIHWTGETISNPSGKLESRDERHKIGIWLADTLRRSGRITSKEMEDACYKANVSWRSAKRVCRIMKIKVGKTEGIPHGPWYYELPPDFNI